VRTLKRASVHVIAVAGLLMLPLAGMASAATTPGFNCPNPAHKYPPGQCKKLAMSTSKVEPGGAVKVDGSGFAPNSAVQVYLGAFDQSVATVVTDGSGAFSTKVLVPRNVTTGGKDIVLKGADVAGAPYEMAGHLDVVRSGNSLSQQLAGSDASGIGLAAVSGGLVLVALVGALGASRRRKAGAV
jgi:hypothetical protein